MKTIFSPGKYTYLFTFYCTFSNFLKKMGIFVSREKKWSKNIDRQLESSYRRESDATKLLLLGTSDCGKSTVLKQMKILHGINFTESEIQLQKTTIYLNIISAMKIILDAMETYQIRFDNLEIEVNASKIREVYETLQQQAENFTLTTEVVTSVKKLLDDCGVQECFQRGSEYNLNDSTKYFFDNIDRISEPNYLPNEQDILRSRISTTGIVEIKFQAKDLIVRMFDVGGQRSERRKWIHCFDNVDAVFYLASLSEYNMVLLEDGTTNRMQESLKLFEQLSQSVYFAKAAMILFLNKTDLFQERIKVYPLTIAFPEYSGPQTYEECVKYVESKFLQHNEQTAKDIYIHQTCATDTKGIEFVFNTCIDMIVQRNLNKAGLMV